MDACAIKTFFLSLAVVAIVEPQSAMSAQRPFPKTQSYTAIGSGKFEIEDCTGKTVELTGDRQTITLLGVCKSIVSRGNFTHLTIDGASSLRVVGNGNVVKWNVRPDSVIFSGHGNVLIHS